MQTNLKMTLSLNLCLQSMKLKNRITHTFLPFQIPDLPSTKNIRGCKIQDISTSISIAHNLITVTGEGGKDESDKHL